MKDIIRSIEAEGWSVYEGDDYLEVSKHSPAGEDFSFTVDIVDTANEIIKYAKEFDAEEHAEIHIENRGKNGTPSSIRELLDDADGIQDMLNDLASAVETYVEGRIRAEQESGNHRAPRTFEEVQATVYARRYDHEFNYYDNDDVCIIHAKFGRLQKAYTGLLEENGLTKEFITEFKKYWNREGDLFKEPMEIVNYIKEHNLPVIIYQNFIDEELTYDETVTYFVDGKLPGEE